MGRDSSSVDSSPAIFLDRDGVINAPFVRDGKPFPACSVEEFIILPGVSEACDLFRGAGFKLVIVTNQPDVGRGTLTAEAVETIHRHMCQRLPIDLVEVCFDAGDVPRSGYRKPAPGMVIRAAKTLNIDLKRSYMIGDRWRDIECGHAAGCATILIDYNYRESIDREPDFRCADLLSAAKLILSPTEKGGTA